MTKEQAATLTIGDRVVWGAIGARVSGEWPINGEVVCFTADEVQLKWNDAKGTIGWLARAHLHDFSQLALTAQSAQERAEGGQR